MAGALTERDFVEKLERAGFGDITIRERRPVSIDDLALYPLFTDELIELMRKLIAPDRQGAVATAIVLTARLHEPRVASPLVEAGVSSRATESQRRRARSLQ